MRRAIVVALILGSAACGGPCTADYRFGLAVSVLSRSTGARICDATVVISDGSYRETLAPGLFDSTAEATQCNYIGAGERAGTYTVVARAATSESTRTDIVVTEDACHVVPRTITLEL
jgi:hypothetical protein